VQECNTEPCGEFSWRIVTSECKATCSGTPYAAGEKLVSSTCHNSNDQEVEDSKCQEADRPSPTQGCSVACAYWHTTAWTDCSIYCEDTKTRTVTCYKGDKSAIDSECEGLKPLVSEACVESSITTPCESNHGICASGTCNCLRGWSTASSMSVASLSEPCSVGPELKNFQIRGLESFASQPVPTNSQVEITVSFEFGGPPNQAFKLLARDVITGSNNYACLETDRLGFSVNMLNSFSNKCTLKSLISAAYQFVLELDDSTYANVDSSDWDGSFEVADPCAYYSCGAHGKQVMCKDKKCQCISGYSGDTCEIEPCSTGECGNGLCNSTTHKCDCDEYYSGTECQTQEACPQSCDNGGANNDACECECTANWTGATCATCSLQCDNRGANADCTACIPETEVDKFQIDCTKNAECQTGDVALAAKTCEDFNIGSESNCLTATCTNSNTAKADCEVTKVVIARRRRNLLNTERRPLSELIEDPQADINFGIVTKDIIRGTVAVVTKQPTSQPTTAPTTAPTTEPTSEPTTNPITANPTTQPTGSPTLEGTQDIACEGQRAVLTCPPGSTIRIKKATYGSVDKHAAEKCGHFTRDLCPVADVTQKVTALCNKAGMTRECHVEVSNDNLGGEGFDPCFGIQKYLTVAHMCHYAVDDQLLPPGADSTSAMPVDLAIEFTKCEIHDRFQVTCPTDSKLTVLEAVFGREKMDICTDGEVQAIPCKSDVLAYYSGRCNGHESCDLSINPEQLQKKLVDVKVCDEGYLTGKYMCKTN